MWIRTSENQIHNLSDVRLLKLVEVKNEEGEQLWAIKAFFSSEELAMTLYVSKDKNAMETVLNNFDAVLGCGRVIKLKDKEEKEEDSSDA